MMYLRAQSGTGKTATFSIAALQSVDIQVCNSSLSLLYLSFISPSLASLPYFSEIKLKILAE